MNKYDELKEFKQLLDEGLITEEEYNRKKNKILDFHDNAKNNDLYVEKKEKTPVVEEKSRIKSNKEKLPIIEDKSNLNEHKEKIHVKFDKKMIIVLILILVVIIGIISGFKLYQSKQPALVLKSQTLELGEDVILDPMNFVDRNKSKNITLDGLQIESDLITDNAKYSYDNKTMKATDKDSDYLSVGDYEITVSTSDQKAKGKVTLEIVDTTKPEFDKAETTIDLTTDDSKPDYSKYFTAKDLSKVTVTCDDSDVDYSKAGTYTLKISAKDEYENENKIDAKVVISEPNYYLGLYTSAYDMNIRSEPSTSGTSVGTFVEGLPVYITEIVKGTDGSLWGKLSTGYVCVQDSTTTYLSPAGYESHLKGIHSDFTTVCLSGIGGIGGADTRTLYTGNVNTTSGCDGQGGHFSLTVVY